VGCLVANSLESMTAKYSLGNGEASTEADEEDKSS